MINGPYNLAYSVTAINNAIPPSESLFEDNVHRSVALSTEFDLCTQSNSLQWSEYEGWEGNISGYKVYGGISGAPMQLLSFVQATTTSYIHSELEMNTTYIYYIVTVNTNRDSSFSALDTVYTLFPEAPTFLTIDHVSVVDEATVEIQYSADIAGPVTSFRLLRRSNPSTPFLVVDTYWNVMESMQVVQDEVITGSSSYQYLVESVFQPVGCASSLIISKSNTGNNILLVNELNAQVLTLSWTPYESYEPGLAGYTIQRRDGSGTFIDVATVGPATTQWQESIEPLVNGFQAGEFQYRVIALSNPHNGGIEEQSFSNITTVELETQMQVPSAFTPNSNDINSEFKPLMDFAPREYLMIVIDRGGRKMFETTDPGEGWDGRFQGGSFVDEAVYVYYIQYTDYTGLFKTYTGNVTVLYP
jgi:gliding motility-associated-like protein